MLFRKSLYKYDKLIFDILSKIIYTLITIQPHKD